MRKAVSTSKVLLLTYILLRVQPGVFKMLMLLGLWRTDSFRLPYLLGEKRKGKRRSLWVLMEQQQQRIHPQRCQILSCCKPRGSDIGQVCRAKLFPPCPRCCESISHTHKLAVFLSTELVALGAQGILSVPGKKQPARNEQQVLLIF